MLTLMSKRKTGQIALGITMLFLSGCVTPQSARVVPNYSADFLLAVEKDGRTCGPAAQEALFDWAVMVGI
jgi:hypothetical protein